MARNVFQIKPPAHTTNSPCGLYLGFSFWDEEEILGSFPDLVYGIFLGSSPAQKVGGSSRHCILKGKGSLALEDKMLSPRLGGEGSERENPRAGSHSPCTATHQTLGNTATPHLGGLGSCSTKGSEQRGVPQPSLRQHLCPSTWLDTAGWREISLLTKPSLKANCDTERKQLAAARSVNQPKRTALNSYFFRAGCDLH